MSTAVFLRATLGFEKEVMEQAHARLVEAEEAASEHQRRAIRDPSTAHQSAIYAPGAEYALCYAESQLMSAVVAVLNESLTESLKGFYRLRKAFTTLYEISESEKRYLEKHGKPASQSTLASAADSTPASSSGVTTPANRSSDADDADDDEFDFVDAPESVSDPATPGVYQGHLESDIAQLSLENGVAERLKQPEAAAATTNSQEAATGADADLDFRTLTSDPVDLFIHSGTALCFGLLQLLLSMVPPAFAKILSIFSFRGDRQAGLRMLWSATKFKKNINGAMAGLIILGFYNGAVAFCDILMRDAVPSDKLKSLLTEMRALYPQSKLWLLEEARMLAADKKLAAAAELTKTRSDSGLKQVNALRLFERSLNCMYLKRYQECADGFVECVGMNSWSHALYYYIAGACYVELYRLHRDADPGQASRYAKQADELLHTVPQHAGKKGFMGRQLPFDVFVLRKLRKWDHRAKSLGDGQPFVEAVGVSPVEEMCYFWSGFKKMDLSQLRESLQRLEWSERQAGWCDEPADEKTIHAFLKAAVFRLSNDVARAKHILTDEVLNHDLSQLKACQDPDTWTLPVAHYEMAVCFWMEAGGEDGDGTLLQRCSDELAKVERWESFDLEARVGLKVTTARETLRRCGITGS